MFENDQTAPRIFAQALGTDFPKALVSGIRSRMVGQPPELFSKITLIVNTERMRRRVRALYASGPPGFLPRILVLSEVERLLTGQPIKPARAKLERQLQLAELLAPIISNRPEFAPKSSVFALAGSLSELMDEIQGEGRTADDIANLDVSDESEHWAFAKTLISVAYDYVSALDGGRDPEARQREIVSTLADQWSSAPPDHPMLLAGSTGSRGTTFELMKLVATLPTGAIILPGFDFNTPADVWASMTNALKFEDHPQFRFARLVQALGIDASNVSRWADEDDHSRDRMAVVSLAMRPAPVTNAWLTEGPDLPELPEAMSRISLLEAPSQRMEAMTISMRMRMAVSQGQTVALISPDRMLGRQVSAALDRWGIIPDDSAGSPLHLSAPGRFLRHTASLLHTAVDIESLLVLLKHPLTQSGGVVPDHGVYTQRLELALRKNRMPHVSADAVRDIIQSISRGRQDENAMLEWGAWISNAFFIEPHTYPYGLDKWIQWHRIAAERIAAGAEEGSGGLWDKAAGEQALTAITEMESNAAHAGDMTATDYSQFLASVLSQYEVRDRDKPHPGVMIWGTLEARVQGADLVILGGLNDGMWPEAFKADPWLNRNMRHKAGLLLPDRKVGLSAHDFQQAIASKEVWLTRSTRSEESETVASRWLNRITNMIGGLPSRNGPDALLQMRARGLEWLHKAEALENVAPQQQAGRAAPIPPVSARPRDLSVTEVRTLIRDPYAVYAKHCLGLRPLDPLVQEPDAPVRGIVIHEIMERFVNDIVQDRTALTTDHLLKVTDAVLASKVPWPAIRMMWRARIARIAAWVIESETSRLERATPVAMERSAQARLALPRIGGSVRARADRIDVTETGEAVLYDYKSGTPPTKKQQKTFDRQLLIEAAMIEQGAFSDLGPRNVEDAIYIGLGSDPKEQPAPLDEETPAETIERLQDLISDYLVPTKHFLSRRMLEKEQEVGDYDQLARHGEWDDSDDPAPEDLT